MTSASMRSRRKPIRFQLSPRRSPAFRPPEEVILVAEGLAVAGVAAAGDGQPEAMDELLRREVAPGHEDVALVFGLVVDDRLAPFLPPLVVQLGVPVLDADVVDPGLAMIEVHRLLAVVDRLRVPIGVVLLDDVEVAVPLRDRLHVEKEVILVGERPPDVANRRQAARRDIRRSGSPAPPTWCNSPSGHRGGR